MQKLLLVLLTLTCCSAPVESETVAGEVIASNFTDAGSCECEDSSCFCLEPGTEIISTADDDEDSNDQYLSIDTDRETERVQVAGYPKKPLTVTPELPSADAADPPASQPKRYADWNTSIQYLLTFLRLMLILALLMGLLLVGFLFAKIRSTDKAGKKPE